MRLRESQGVSGAFQGIFKQFQGIPGGLKSVVGSFRGLPGGSRLSLSITVCILSLSMVGKSPISKRYLQLGYLVQ